jgi:hypothetical protein
MFSAIAANQFRTVHEGGEMCMTDRFLFEAQRALHKADMHADKRISDVKPHCALEMLNKNGVLKTVVCGQRAGSSCMESGYGIYFFKSIANHYVALYYKRSVQVFTTLNREVKSMFLYEREDRVDNKFAGRHAGTLAYSDAENLACAASEHKKIPFTRVSGFSDQFLARILQRCSNRCFAGSAILYYRVVYNVHDIPSFEMLVCFKA